MRSMLAPLSPHEEAALRKIGFGFGSDDRVELAHLRRLLDLQLIEWTGRTWQLTQVGRQRYEGLVVDGGTQSAA
jgi:hypothetical protein